MQPLASAGKRMQAKAYEPPLPFPGPRRPQAISGSAFAVAGALVLMAGITGVVYIRTQWDVKSPKELGDKLREKGAARKEALETGGTVRLVRTFSQQADASVKENVELIRKPSHQLGEHFTDTFKGGVGAGKAAASAEGAKAATTSVAPRA